MENSVLSDAAGVQKNISKMYEDYAKSIGKSTDALTQAEKAQAVYNGIMAEASMFTGSAAEMAQGYQGIQAQANASSLELSRTIGESIIPALTQYSSLQLSLTKGLTEFSKEHKGATSGVITFTTTLLAMIVGLTAAKKAYISYKTAAAAADMTTKAFTISLMSNPVTLIAVGIAAVVGGLSIFNTKMQESIDKMDEATERSNALTEAMQNFAQNGQFTEDEKSTVEKERNEAQEIVKIYEDRNKRIEELQNEIKGLKDKGGFLEFELTAEEVSQMHNAEEELRKLTEAQKKQEKQLDKTGKTIEGQKFKVKELNRELSQSKTVQGYLTATNTKANREQLVTIAQTKADIDGKRNLLNILKNGKVGTDQYTDAQKQLVKVYPELAHVNENTIASTESLINEEEKAAQSEWDLAQSTIKNSITELEAMKSNDQKVQEIAIATRQKVEDVRSSIEAATNSLKGMLNLTMPDFAGIVDTSNFTPKVKKSSSGGSKSSKSYENKKLDNYKKLIEYKKSLDKISLEDEIKMYKKALNEYAKTTDEKRELRTKIYELEKELQEKSLDDYTSKIEHKKALDKVSLEKEIKMYEKAYKNLAKTTEQKEELEEKLYELRKELAEKNKELMQEELEAYEENIEKQKKIRGSAYTTIEEESDIYKLIEKHNKYLDKVFKDEKLSKQKKKEIQKEELESIKELEEKKKDIRVENTNNMLSLLKDAITKQLEDEEKAQKEAIENNIKAIEEWKDARIKVINEEYDARIKTIEKELDLLNKSEEEKTRAEEDAEYERKKKRLEELVAFEHDIVTKANYQKELDKLIAEHKKTLDKRELQDKKDALNEQKELLKEEQSKEVKYIEDQAEKQKEQYEKEIDELEKFYDKKKDLAEETAKQMILNADKSQKQIIDLLKSYNGTYETLGQNFGEKLVYGMSNKIADNIQNVVSKIQNTIDSNINSKIKSWTSSIDKAQSSTKQAQVQNKTITVNQTNQIVQNPEMPSETYRKLKDIDRALADRLAGV